jgi:hypothetical protein
VKERKEKRIQNEGKSYSAVQPEVRVNQAYFERTGKYYGLTQPEINPRKEEEESLARVTGKEFAESLRRRAARNQEQNLEIEDMSEAIENAFREEASADEAPEIRVDLDAEYFKWKEGAAGENVGSGKKERRFLFGRKSNSQ